MFEDFTAEERSKLFGEPPATVWENLCAFEKYPEKVAVLTQGNILKKEYIDSFMQGALIRWKTELLTRLIPENYQAVIDMKRLHNQETCTDCDLAMWRKIQNLRAKLAKDSFEEKSIFTAIRRAVAEGDYDTVSSSRLRWVQLWKSSRLCITIINKILSINLYASCMAAVLKVRQPFCLYRLYQSAIIEKIILKLSFQLIFCMKLLS